MARFHTTPEGNIPFTPEEEAEWDAQEAEWAASAKDRFNAEQKRMRENAYLKEADPMFFKAQRGELTVAEWEAKVTEIRQRFPYQE